jgi:glycosyltransferase involved in cell wall biosynthesis
MPEIKSGNSWEWKLIRQAVRLADAVLLLDKKSEEAIKSALPGSRVQVIPNPVEMSLFEEAIPRERLKRTAGSPAKIVFAGWVVPTKGVRELVEACTMIGDVPFQLDLIGSVKDDFRGELEAIAGQKDSGGWLRFHGMVGRHEALAAIGSADVFVLPSYTEGFPNVVSEAMAMGRPIVATRVGAIPEMLGEATNEPCGIVVSPRQVKELLAAITYLLTRPEEAAIFGERARKKALALYSRERVMQRYAELWNLLARQEFRRTT